MEVETESLRVYDVQSRCTPSYALNRDRDIVESHQECVISDHDPFLAARPNLKLFVDDRASSQPHRVSVDHHHHVESTAAEALEYESCESSSVGFNGDVMVAAMESLTYGGCGSSVVGFNGDADSSAKTETLRCGGCGPSSVGFNGDVESATATEASRCGGCGPSSVGFNGDDESTTATESPRYGGCESSVVGFNGDVKSSIATEALRYGGCEASVLGFNGDGKLTATETQDCTVADSLVVLSPSVKSTALNGQINAKFESTAALKLQKVYRSYRTRRRLADSAVVAEELWWQVIDFVRLNRSTVSFFNFEKPETAASRWNRVSLNASKVGKGLSKDGKALKLAFQHWIEAIDPRHRYGHNLHLYYEEWCKTEAEQPFFFWLDIGDGRLVDLKECPRSKLRKQCIKYLGPHEREHYEYIVVEGKIVHKQTGELLDTSKFSQGAKWIFVMSTFKKLYASEKMKGIFHHSSFLAGGATLAAGRLDTYCGVLKSISAYSGHYKPNDENLDTFLNFLKENGVNLNEVQIRYSEEYQNYDDGKSVQGKNALVKPKGSEPPLLKIPSNLQEKQTSTEAVKTERAEVVEFEPAEAAQIEPIEVAQTETKSSIQRTSSISLQSPRAEVPKKAILQRINSKKAASSYQLGHQLSLKWSTGAGPRIGCVADYPMELRMQALEFVQLSPRTPPTPSSFRRLGSAFSPKPPSPHP